MGSTRIEIVSGRGHQEAGGSPSATATPIKNTPVGPHAADTVGAGVAERHPVIRVSRLKQ